MIGRALSIITVVMILLLAVTLITGCTAQSKYETLAVQYEALVSQYEALNSQYEDLTDRNSAIQGELNQLKPELKDFELKTASLQSQIDEMGEKHESEIADYQVKITEAFFTFYYITPAKLRYGSLYDLQTYMDSWQWVDNTFTSGVFGASEIAAAIEYKLENVGYPTTIRVADSFPVTGLGHTWLMVEWFPEEWVPIEPTSFRMVSHSHEYFSYYLNDYDYEFEDIHQALDAFYDEFDWWNSL